jgi:hypothetical protein
VRLAYRLALEQLAVDPPTSSGDDPAIERATTSALRSVNADFE